MSEAAVPDVVEPRRDASRRRRLLVPVSLALVRLRHSPGRTLTVAAGIAVGAAVLAMTIVAGAAVRDRAVQVGLAQVQPSYRAVQAVWSGVPGQSSLSLAQLDRLARRALTPVFGQEPFRVALFRQATWGGAYASLGAVDGLDRWVRLRSGRLPRPCRPRDCELLQIGGAPVAPKLPYLHVVGRAAFVPGAPLGAYFSSGAPGQRQVPVLLARGVGPFTRTPLPDAPLIARTYGWIVPVDARRVHDWQLASLGRRLDRVAAQLQRESDIFSLAAPTGTLAQVRATGSVAAERLLILGGEAGALLLGFAVLAAGRLRRDHAELRRRLQWAGAGRGQTLLASATEVAVVSVGASVVGWAAGLGAGVLLADRIGSPGRLLLAHAVLTPRNVAVCLALLAVTVAAMLVTLHVGGVAVAGLRLTAADALAAGALAAVLLALARGKTDASALQASGGTGVLLLLLPGLVLFALAVAGARLLSPLLRTLERLTRGAPVTLRVAVLSLARSPGQVALTAVFFLLSVGVAVFAVAYRATLLAGEREQADFAVPAPFVLGEDLTRLVTVQQAPPPARFPAVPVYRDDGYVGGTQPRDVTVLALPARAIAAVDGWRADFSSDSPARLAALLEPRGPAPRLAGIALPAAARRLTLPFRIRGDRLGLTLVVENRRGDFTTLPLGEHDRGAHVVSVRLPRAVAGGRIVALRLSFPLLEAFAANHRESGTALSVSDASTGVLTLGRPRAGGRRLGAFPGWHGENGVAVLGPGRFHYLANRAADTIVRPTEPGEGEPVPVVASPAVARAAGADGVVPLHVLDHVVPAHVVATARWFPSVDGDAVVADLPTWLTALNALEPGAATASELWVDAPPAAAPALGRLPLQVASQAAAERAAREDPLARGSIALLSVTAAVGLALAAVAAVLAVVSDLGDEGGALRDLEAQGASPRRLRRYVLARTAVVGVVGTGAGIAAGAIVSGLVVAVVTVTAGAADAFPPLALVFGRWTLAAGLGLAALASAAGALLAVRRLR